MTPTGWPPATDQWAWRVLVAISDQLHAYHHALALLATIPANGDAAPGALARPLAAAANAAVTIHDHPSLFDLLRRHGHHHTAQRWQELSNHDALDAIQRLRDLAWRDQQHHLTPLAVPRVITLASTAFQQAGQQLADLERDLLTTLHPPVPPTDLVASSPPTRYNNQGGEHPQPTQ